MADVYFSYIPWSSSFTFLLMFCVMDLNSGWQEKKIKIGPQDLEHLSGPNLEGQNSLIRIISTDST